MQETDHFEMKVIFPKKKSFVAVLMQSPRDREPGDLNFHRVNT